MTRRSIVLSDEQIGVIQTLVGSGRFADAEAVVDAGLRLVVSHSQTEAEKRGALLAERLCDTLQTAMPAAQ